MNYSLNSAALPQTLSRTCEPRLTVLHHLVPCPPLLLSVPSIHQPHKRTVIHDRNSVPVVDERRQRIQGVLVSQSLVVDLDEGDAQLVGFVVDVLQLFEGAFTLAAAGFVCGRTGPVHRGGEGL